MKIITTLITILLFSISELNGQEVKVYNFDQFEQFLNQDGDSLYLINFWATWCVPCVKEIPALNKIAHKYTNSKLSIVMVSLDIPDKLNTRLIPFIKKHGIRSKVIVLDDPDFNSWIDKVDKNWGGAIPATLIYSKSDREFYEQSFEYDQLNHIIKSKLEKL